MSITARNTYISNFIEDGRYFLRNPGLMAVTFIAVALILLFIVIPIGSVLVKSFTVSFPTVILEIKGDSTVEADFENAVVQPLLEILRPVEGIRDINRKTENNSTFITFRFVKEWDDLRGLNDIKRALAANTTKMAFSVSNIKYRLDRESIISLDTYREFFSTPYYHRALRNSLVLGVVSTFLVIPIAFCYAFLGLKGPKIISRPVKILGLLPLIAPPFIFALALILLGGRQGILTKFLHLPFDLYGWPGIIIAQTITFLPLGYLLIQNVLRSLGSSLEEAAIDMGAGSFEVLRKITIPLAAPGILKAALLVFILSLADFGNPMLIGGGVSLLATDAYLLWIGENNLEMAAVFCVFLVLPSLTVFLIHEYLLKGREYTTIGGKPQQDEERKITPNILYPMLVVIVPVSLLIILSFGIIVMGAFTKIIMIDNSFTLEHFNTVNGIRSLITSVRFAFGAALIAPIIGITLSYLLVRKRIPLKRVLESSALLGFAVPGTVMGIGYILFFNSPPLLLTGTFAIMILNEAFRNISVSLEAGISKLHQMDVSIEEAAIDMGANAFRVYTRIILPIISSAFVAGFIYTFMVGMIAVSAVIFLISPGNNLVALYILAVAETGFLGMACALSLMLIAVVLACLGVLNLLSRYTGIKVY